MLILNIYRRIFFEDFCWLFDFFHKDSYYGVPTNKKGKAAILKRGNKKFLGFGEVACARLTSE